MITRTLIPLVLLLVGPVFADPSVRIKSSPPPFYPAILVDGVYQDDGIETNGKTYVPLQLLIDIFHATVSAKVEGGKNIISLSSPVGAPSYKSAALIAAPAVAHIETGAMVLKGIKSIAVEVEPLNLDLQNAGITADDLKTECELRLRGAGVNVVRFENLASSPKPTADLVVTVSTAKVTGWAVYSYYTDLQLKRLTASIDDPNLKYLTTIWQSTTPTLSTADTVMDDVTSTLDGLAGKFSSDYIKANIK